jgi:hypothetical protein
LLAAAERLGPSVAAFCEVVMADRPHPAQGFRTCLCVIEDRPLQHANIRGRRYYH